MPFLTKFIEQYPILSFLLIPIAFYLFWIRARHGALGLSQGRTKRLFLLTQGEKWRNAGPAALEIAVIDALGIHLDSRWIEYALKRERTLKVLKDEKLGMGIAQLLPNGSGFVDKKLNRRISLRTWSIFFFTNGMAPWIAAWALVAFGAPVDPKFLIGFVIWGVMATPFCLWLSACLEAARRLIVEADKHYPPRGIHTVTSISAPSDIETGKRPRRK